MYSVFVFCVSLRLFFYCFVVFVVCMYMVLFLKNLSKRYTVNSREHVKHFECVAYQNTGIFKQNFGDL